MSTVCKICVKAPVLATTAAIEKYLLAENLTFSKSTTEWPLSDDHDSFINDSVEPSVLSIKQVAEDITEIRFNSFGKVAKLASALSTTLSTGVVVNIFQSVSDSSYWAYHLNGGLARDIEAGDGEVFAQSGAPLESESEEPGHDISEDDEEPCIIFDYEDMDAYNRFAEIPIDVYQPADPDWQPSRRWIRRVRRPEIPVAYAGNRYHL